MSRSPISGSSSPVSGQSFRAAPLAAYLSQQNGAIGSLGLPPSALEVLLGIAFKQAISQAEIDRLFDADKRGLVVKLRDLKLLEEFAGADGIFNNSLTQRKCICLSLKPSIIDALATSNLGKTLV
jgi:hypothetical protein